MKKSNTRQGFTLIEVLVVILIIGVLAAIALPQYQKAVLKSRFTALMPIGKSLADSNEAYYLEHGSYAANPQDLPVQGQAEYPDGTSVLLYPGTDDLSFVRVSNTYVPNAQYVVYQKHSANFPDTTWCEAGDERAEEMCVALGGVIPTGVTGNSSGQDGWKAYLLSGQAYEGDSFVSVGEGGNSEPATPTCSGEQPAAINAPNGATGTATCVNGQWKYQWTGGQVYSANYPSGTTTVCNSGSTAYACAGSEYRGLYNECSAAAEGGCAGSTFSGDYTWCYGDATDGCAGSTYSGVYANCQALKTNACGDSIFNGQQSRCIGQFANGCAGSSFLAGSYCQASARYGCDGVKYGEDPTGQRTGMGVCYDGNNYCPNGSPIMGSWNETNQSYDYTWKGNCCNPAYMVSGVCPSGIAVCE